jgi:hypothetical protein
LRKPEMDKKDKEQLFGASQYKRRKSWIWQYDQSVLLVQARWAMVLLKLPLAQVLR